MSKYFISCGMPWIGNGEDGIGAEIYGLAVEVEPEFCVDGKGERWVGCRKLGKTREEARAYLKATFGTYTPSLNVVIEHNNRMRDLRGIPHSCEPSPINDRYFA